MIHLRRGPEYLHEREPLVRPYEKVMLVLIAFLFAALAVAIIAVGTTTSGTGAQRGGDAERQASHPAQQPSEEAPGGLLRSSGEKPEDAKGTESARGDALLCSPEERLFFERSGSSGRGRGLAEPLGLAVDPYGRFALYGAAKPETGRPTPDSQDLLRGCAPGSPPRNRAAVSVEGFYAPGEAGEAGRRTVARETHREEGEPGTLVTLYRFRGGVVLEQRLSLAGGLPDGSVLVASYRLANVSGEPRTVGLRSVLVPPPASPSGPARGPAFLADGAGVDREHELAGEERGAGILVPRPAVPTDSTGRWVGTETPTGPKPALSPDAVVIAGVDALSGEGFRHRPDEDRKLPKDAAIGAFWLDRELAPGEVLNLAHTYGPAESPASPNGAGSDEERQRGDDEVDGSKAPAGVADEKGAS